MDEMESVKRKVDIKVYRMVALSLIIAGFVLLTISSVFLFVSFVLFVIFFGLSGACFISGVWVRSKARNLEIALEAFEKMKRQQETAQQHVHSVATESVAQLHCPSCGKKFFAVMVED